MDSTVRIWNLRTGECIHTLRGHTSLVGLLSLSANHLVSAAADSSLRVWNPSTGELQHLLACHTGAITCAACDDVKILSGSDGTLKMWDIQDGSEVRDLLPGASGVWQVAFEGRWCVAASNHEDQTMIHIWDFGENDKGQGDPKWFGKEPVAESGDDD